MADLAVDICVVGAGSGGTSIAAAAAQLGRNVVLIDRGERGDHLRIASKALIAAARAAEAGRSGAEFGIAPATPEIDAKKLHAHIREIIVEVKAQNARVPFEGVKLIRDQAAFLDRKTLRSGDSRIRAKTFVLAAGTRAKIPDFADLESVPFFTTDTIFEKDVIPQHLIVLGGGSTGIELAQAHRRLGADVTVIDNARLLADYERPLAQIVLDQLLRDGIRLREGAKISRIDRSSVGVRVEIGRVQGAEIIEGSHLLVATGRAADVETLDLAKANVTCSERGIVVDKDLRTSNRRIYAIGDSVAAPQRVRGAHWHAAFLVRSLFAAQAAHGPHDALASVLHSDPEIATLGMSAAEAKAEKLTFEIVTSSLEETDRGRADRIGESRVDILVGKKGRVLGVTMVARNASELIVPWVIAVGEGVPLSHLAGLILPYPSLGEHMKRLTASYYGSPLFKRRAPAGAQVLANLR